MHTFLYPQKDTYITNEVGYADKNFGIDEILELRSYPHVKKNLLLYQSSSLTASFYSTTVTGFSGSVSGSNLDGGTSYGYGNLRFHSSASITFTGSLLNNASGTGSFVGIFIGSPFYGYSTLNGINYGEFGSQNVALTNVSGTISGFSGSFSGSIIEHDFPISEFNALIGNFTGSIYSASGSVDNFTGDIYGYAVGSQSLYVPYIVYTDVPDYSRILIKFDINVISQSISNNSINSNVKFNLKLKASSVSEIPVDYSVYGYPISQSWNMGTGRFSTGGNLVGASWDYRNYAGDSGSYWFPVNANPVPSTSSFVNQGGTWYTSVPTSYVQKSSSLCSTLVTGSSLICSQSFDYTTSDINMDITTIVKGWLCGCVPNEGIILVSSLETVATNGIDSTIKFFSKETNTIYQPYIDIAWDDSVYTTGSMVPLTGNIPYTIIMQNLSKEYKFGSIPRINVFAREKYPLKNFVKGYQQNAYLSSSLLPSASYYCIKDNESENVVIDFDNNTKISSDGNIHYFNIDTTGLPVERFYRILIKTTFDTQTNVFDNGNIFKITR
jgi:hypothetical protein